MILWSCHGKIVHGEQFMNDKAALWTGIIGGIVAILVAVGVYFGVDWSKIPLPTPAPSPSPTVTPTPTPVIGDVMIANSFEKPEYVTEEMWNNQVTRTVLTGQPTGFVIRAIDPCELVNTTGLSRIDPIEVTHPSFTGAQTGTHYDAIVPLTEENCSTTAFMWLEVPAGTDSVTVGDALVTLIRRGQSPGIPTIPMMMEFGNWSMIQGYCLSYCNEEGRGIQALQVLREHRIHPYKSNIVTYSGNTAQFQANVVNFATHFLNTDTFNGGGPNYDMTDAQYQQFESDVVENNWNAWFYTMDEPQGDTALTALRTKLARQRSLAPSVRRMVTTTYRSDLADVDIYCPVAEHFDTDGHPDASAYEGRDLWAYVSCMSHGCGQNRGWLPDPNNYTHIDYPKSGAPNPMIDDGAVEMFGFYIMALKYNLEALLYYNTTESWPLYRRGVDVWTDPYNFGGNGDGLLLYPDRENLQALPSIRLKLFREASYFSDLLKLVSDQTWVSTQIDSIMRSPTDWNQNLRTIESLRAEAFDRL
jgi:hypothetical protein